MKKRKLFQKTGPMVMTGILAMVVSCGVPTDENSSEKVQRNNSNEYNHLKKGFIFQNKQPVEISYVEQDGFARLSDDILVPINQVHPTDNPPTNLAAYAGIAKWANGRVPYLLAANFPYIADFNAAVADWAVAGISWVPRTAADVNFVSVTADLLDPDLCGLADPGQGPSKQLRVKPLGTTCPTKYTLLHEMAHSLGFLHEFLRSDRDSYLTGLTGTVHVKIPNSNNIFNGPFDYSSVTMYPTSAIPTMKTIGGASIPTPTGLSQLDLDRTSAYYFGNYQCSIVGGAGTTLFSGVTSKFGCASQCNSRSATNPERSCTWNNSVFFGLSQCSIVGGLGTTLFNSSVTRFQCTQECNGRSITNPDRSCTWNNIIFAGAAQCSIVGGLGASLYSAVVAKYPCVLQCRSRATSHVNRSCVWNGTNIKGQ